MKTNILAVAALAAVAFAMSACGSTPAQIDSAFTNAQTVFMAAKATVDADAQAGIIDATTAKQIDGYITAGDLALSGAQAAFSAGDATTEQAKLSAVLTATTQINAAILTAVATYSSE
jgi:hypothetical protein